MGLFLDTAIGLVTTFLLYSVLSSAIQEYIAKLLNLRGRMLHEATMRLLDGNVSPSDAQGKKLGAGCADWLRAMRRALDNSRAHHLHSGRLSGRVLHNGTLAALFRGQRLPSYIPPDRFADAVIDEFRQSARDAAPTLDGIRHAIDKLPRGRPREALAAMAASATDVAAFHAAVATWFSDMMDRVSGWYTRQVGWILLAIGLVLAVASNADTFYIIGRIAADPKLRTDFAGTVAHSVTMKDGTVTLANGLTGPLDQLPIGWKQPNVTRPTTDTPSKQRLTIGAILSAIPGWVIMGIAVSLGAPFWFDLLQRLMQIRGTGPSPAQPDTAGAPRQPTSVDNKAAPVAPGGPAASGDTNLSPDDIRFLQVCLGVPMTGALDPPTRSAIVAFQRKSGLGPAADGNLTTEVVQAIQRGDALAMGIGGWSSGI